LQTRAYVDLIDVEETKSPGSDSLDGVEVDRPQPTTAVFPCCDRVSGGGLSPPLSLNPPREVA